MAVTIPVIASGNFESVGQIVAQSGMKVRNAASERSDLTIFAVSNGLIQFNNNQWQYPHYVSIFDYRAADYGWSTGVNCTKYGGTDVRGSHFSGTPGSVKSTYYTTGNVGTSGR
jgi:ribosomal protein L27